MLTGDRGHLFIWIQLVRGHHQDVLAALAAGQRPGDQQGRHVPQAEGLRQRCRHLENF